MNRLWLYLLQNVYRLRRQETYQKYNRLLSFADYVVDRWERAKFYGFGEGTSVYDNVLIIGSVVVGKHCWIGPNCILDGSGGLEIGDYCSISAGTHIYTHNTVEWSLSGGEKPAQHKSVFIGNYVYIGPNAVIAMGTRIHDQCVIGALTFLNGDEIPPNSRVFGIPGKIQNSANINIQHPK